MKQEWERLLSEARELGIPPEQVRDFLLNQALSQHIQLEQEYIS
ncbi:DNA-binding anti-repressor SinI [Paenalkalicoccus suaedae]|nr:DNA-binding anti-repressor SinI [Paenalkalicoccus suaedae]